jgi:hypothetical protein
MVSLVLLALPLPSITRAASCSCEVVSWFADAAKQGLYDDRAATIARAEDTIAKLAALPPNCYVTAHRDGYTRLLVAARRSKTWGRKQALDFVRSERKRFCHGRD